jgi:hypothetical protein
MTDRPSTPPPGDPDPQRPDQVTPGPPPPTAPLPPAAPPAYGAAAAPARGAPSGPRRLWGEATSTGGGRAALVAAAILGALLLVTGVGLVAALVGLVADDGRDRDERVGMSEPWGPGNGKGLGQGQDRRNGDRQGMGEGMGRGMGDEGEGDVDDAPGPGRGRGGGAIGGDVLHGEFTTGATGTPTVMVVQTGVVTAYTAGESIAVESADGFRGTYSLDGAIAAPRNVAVATGTQVRVVAAKDGMTVTRLVVLD